MLCWEPAAAGMGQHQWILDHEMLQESNPRQEEPREFPQPEPEPPALLRAGRICSISLFLVPKPTPPPPPRSAGGSPRAAPVSSPCPAGVQPVSIPLHPSVLPGPGLSPRCRAPGAPLWEHGVGAVRETGPSRSLVTRKTTKSYKINTKLLVERLCVLILGVENASKEKGFRSGEGGTILVS